MLSVSQKFSYKNVLESVSDLKRRFEFADFTALGRTWCSRAVIGMSLGTGRETVLFAGGINGRDTLSAEILFNFFERLCTAYRNDLKISAIKTRNALRERKITVVPFVNPDGAEIARRGADGAGCYRGLVSRAANGDYSQWDANARGVDISKNFDYGFSLSKGNTYPSPKGYKGPSPESEPETKAIVSLCAKENLKHIILVSQSGEKIYYNQNGKSSDTAMMAQILKSVCNYGLSKKTDEQKSGGMCEWFTEEYNKPSFEIAVGKAEAEESAGDVYGKIEELLMLSAIM